VYLPRGTGSCFRSAAPSSTLEGYKGPWNDSCFEPLSHEVSFESRRAFAKFEEDLDSDTPSIYLDAVNDEDEGDITFVVDDEGFFESAAHLDCDPHLVRLNLFFRGS